MEDFELEGNDLWIKTKITRSWYVYNTYPY